MVPGLVGRDLYPHNGQGINVISNPNVPGSVLTDQDYDGNPDPLSQLNLQISDSPFYEDINGNGQLDQGEDLNGNGLVSIVELESALARLPGGHAELADFGLDQKGGGGLLLRCLDTDGDGLLAIEEILPTWRLRRPEGPGSCSGLGGWSPRFFWGFAPVSCLLSASSPSPIH